MKKCRDCGLRIATPEERGVEQPCGQVLVASDNPAMMFPQRVQWREREVMRRRCVSAGGRRRAS